MQWPMNKILKNNISEQTKLCKQNYINIYITKKMKLESMKKANMQQTKTNKQIFVFIEF